MVNYFNNLQNIGVYIFGDMSTVAIMLLLVFIVGLIMIGLNVKFSVLASLPLALAFQQIGWLKPWVAALYWVIVVGFIIYQIITLYQQEQF